MTHLLPLVLQNATARYRRTTVVGPIDLTLDGTGITVVLGPNGSGKTSLLRMMHGTARLAGGSVTWACDVETARANQAFVFQQPIMLRRSVLENLAYPLRLRGLNKRKALDQATDWADRVGLGAILTRPAPVLSGGEQQKLALARALITAPTLVFLDEPCAALDGKATREIETILTEALAAGTRLVLTTHDMGQARRLADDVIFLLRGKIHEHGCAKLFFDYPTTPEARAFLKGDIVE